jgi:hypothetical protein
VVCNLKIVEDCGKSCHQRKYANSARIAVSRNKRQAPVDNRRLVSSPTLRKLCQAAADVDECISSVPRGRRQPLQVEECFRALESNAN